VEYSGIFDAPDWEAVAISVLQTATLFCFVMIGLRIVGRRIFAQRDPQDLVVIVLLAEACNLGLTDENAGYWGTVFSMITIFVLGFIVERVPFLRHFMTQKPVLLYQQGALNESAMKKYMLDEGDLNEVARRQGTASYRSFERMILEGDGSISGIKASGPGSG
jgi:uncharacterized membrane protein YcaP (DUF421 family)